MSLFCPHTTSDSFPTVDHSSSIEGIHPDIISHHIIFPASLGVFQYLASESIPDVSLFESLSPSSLIPDELICSWCNRWWQDMRRRGRLCRYDSIVVWISPVPFSFVPFFFLSFFPLSIPPPPPLCHHLYLPLCSVFAPFSLPHPSPPSLPLALSSLQEVLELAFSVLYESDEYLNFIAPDKHEVSQRCL